VSYYIFPASMLKILTELRFTNVSVEPCSVQGSPRITFTQSDGTDYDASAENAKHPVSLGSDGASIASGNGTSVIIAPGAFAVLYVQTGNDCTPYALPSTTWTIVGASSGSITVQKVPMRECSGEFTLISFLLPASAQPNSGRDFTTPKQSPSPAPVGGSTGSPSK
jgi:hypothetical protein